MLGGIGLALRYRVFEFLRSEGPWVGVQMLVGMTKRDWASVPDALAKCVRVAEWR